MILSLYVHPFLFRTTSFCPNWPFLWILCGHGHGRVHRHWSVWSQWMICLSLLLCGNAESNITTSLSMALAPQILCNWPSGEKPCAKMVLHSGYRTLWKSYILNHERRSLSSSLHSTSFSTDFFFLRALIATLIALTSVFQNFRKNHPLHRRFVWYPSAIRYCSYCWDLFCFKPSLSFSFVCV